MGQWLKTNGDAIYGTTQWKILHEGQKETLLEGTGNREQKGFSRKFSVEDFWFTAKSNKVYAISLASKSDIINIKSLQNSNVRIKEVSLLGSSSKLNWEQTKDELIVNLSGVKTDKNGFALEIKLKQND